MFQILEEKSLVTTGMIDGAKKDLNLNNKEFKDIDLKELAAQDGTLVVSNSSNEKDSNQ